MIHPHAETWIPDEFHGYGIFVIPRAGATGLSHGGTVNGFVASLQYYPALEASVIVLCNSREVAIQSIADTLSDAILGHDR